MLGPLRDTGDRSIPTVGIDDATRQAIRSYPIPLTDLSPRATATPGSKGFEPEGFVADVVRQGRLYFRAERYAEALTVLEMSDDPEAAYWLARCLERLDRTEEAIEALKALIASESASTLADRARRDLDFLTWKRDFEERRSSGGGK
jgi:tetratricopeptide (TPR) repeat protein